MKIDSKLIDIADKAIYTNNIVNTNGIFDNRFKGYISSFGASIVQSGLLPTVIFFEQSSEKAEKRELIIPALKQMLNEYYHYDINDECKLFRFIINQYYNGNDNNNQDNYVDYHAFENDVTTCMVAMKLALRMYQSDKKTEKSHDK